MLGGIADGVSEVSGFLESEDCLATMKAMRALGVRVDQVGPQAIRVHGVGLRGLSLLRTHWIWGIRAQRCA